MSNKKRKLKRSERELLERVSKTRREGYEPSQHEINQTRALARFGLIKSTTPDGEIFVATRKGSNNLTN